MRRILALFDNSEKAARAAQQLVGEGVSREQVTIGIGAEASGGLGVADDVALYYAEVVARGGGVLSVQSDDSRARSIEARLRGLDATDVRDYPLGERTMPRPTMPIYDAQSVTPSWSGSHQESTGDAEAEEAARDTRVKTDSGPEHWAPRNPSFDSTFDEFAGVFRRDHTTFMANRGVGYDRYRAAFEFGYRNGSAERRKGTRWVLAEPQLQSNWERTGNGDWPGVREFVELGWEAARGMG